MSTGIESQNHIRQNDQGPRNYGAYSEGAHRPGEMKVPEHDDLSFWDVLDVVNPLQHIPGVNMAYRAVTGDQIEAPARILGGMLYGGPTGFVSAIANSLMEEGTGRDLGETVVAQVFGEDAAPIDDEAQQYASNQPSSSSPAPVEKAPARINQESEAVRQSSESLDAVPESAAKSEAGSGTSGLTGMDALRAFASDQQSSPSSAQQSSTVPEDKTEGDQYALNPSATPPTTASTTSEPANGGRPGEVQQAQAPQSTPANRNAGGPPPTDSFMPLDRANLRGRTTASAERTPPSESVSGPAADQSMSAGSMQGGEKMGMPGAAMNVMPGEPRDKSRPAPADPGLSAQDEKAFPSMKAGDMSGDNVAEQMKAALLKYQALQDE